MAARDAASAATSAQIRDCLSPAIAALFECKPKDPISFLKAYFRHESDNDTAARSALVLRHCDPFRSGADTMIHDAYSTFAETGHSEVLLSQEIYRRFLSLLTNDLPEAVSEKTVHKLSQALGGTVCFSDFRTGVLTAMCLRRFVKRFASETQHPLEFYEAVLMKFSDLDALLLSDATFGVSSESGCQDSETKPESEANVRCACAFLRWLR